jgi:hypothetical protein
MSVAVPAGRLLLPDVEEASTAVARTPGPTVAVLCDPRHGRAAAAAVALALAAACGRSCGVAAAVGAGAAAPLPLTAAARRGAALLVGRGYEATATGRLVWLADLRVSRPVGVTVTDRVGSGRLGSDSADAGPGGAGGAGADRLGSEPVGAVPVGSGGVRVDPLHADPVGAVAAASLELAGAARAIGVPAALAIPLARSAALDRVLGWHDGIVVVQDGRVETRELEPLVLGSLAALDRPVASMALPPRAQARTAALGLRTPAAAVHAVAALGLAAGMP